MKSQTPHWISIVVRLILSIVILAGGTCIGLLIGLDYPNRVDNTARIPWQSLGAPSEKVKKILVIDLSEIYVQTAGGQIYACDASKTRDCWSPASEAPTYLDSGQRHCISDELPVPPPPTKAVLTTEVCQGEIPQVRRYILGEDNQIWSWEHSASVWWGNFSTGLTLGPTLGFGVGFIFCVLIWLIKDPSHDKTYQDAAKHRHSVP